MSEQRQTSSRANDRMTVLREYAAETRFLARRLTTWAELRGPLVEDRAIEAVGEGRPTRVVDVGSGTGDFSERLRRELGVELVGLDLSARMTALVRQRGLPALRANLEALPFPDRAFDCVLANRVLYHLPDLERGVSEIARVLRAGGRLIAVTYGTTHLRELFDLVGQSPLASSPFSAENGAGCLRKCFETVERRDVTGAARFSSVDSIRGYLAAYGEFADADLSARLDEVRAPFDATYQHSIFIASN